MPVTVTVLIFLVVYGGAFIGVVFFDYCLHRQHWINKWIKEDETDQIDGDARERGNPKIKPTLFQVQEISTIDYSDVMKLL